MSDEDLTSTAEPFSDQPILLSEVEQAVLQKWVNEAKPLLALSEWDIRVTLHQSSDATAYAMSWIREHGDETVIALGIGFRDRTPDQLRADLTHELMHPHFHRLVRLMLTLIEKELGVRTEAVIEAAIRQREEEQIDRLARAVARFLPFVVLPQ